MKSNTILAAIYELDSNTPRSSAMEGVRGFAVLLVFFVHCFGLILSRRLNANIEDISIGSLDGWNRLFMWLFMSHHGVYLFFILSGFLIFRILQKPSFSYPHFLWKRVVRIYPAFLFSLFACLFAGIYLFRSVAFDSDVFLKNLIFLNGLSFLHIPGYNKVTWSLFNEFAFYLVVPLAFILIGRRLLQEKWRVAALGVFLIYGPKLLIGFDYVDTRFLFFFVGAFIALCEEGELRRFSKVIPTHFVIGCYVFATAVWMYRIVDFGTYLIFFAAGSGLLFIKASYGEGLLPKLFTLRPLRYLGNISYSFYLIHALIIDLIFALLNRYGDVLSGWIGMLCFILLAFGTSWIAGTLMFLTLERPYFASKREMLQSERAT